MITALAAVGQSCEARHMRIAVKISSSGEVRARRAPRSGLILLSVCAAVALTACSGGSSTLSIMESGAPASRVSQDIIDTAEVNAESLRALGETDAAQYFVAWKDDDGLKTADPLPCLIAVQGVDEWSVGCGGQSPQVLVELQSADHAERSMLVTDDAEVDEFVDAGWRQISQNLLVR